MVFDESVEADVAQKFVRDQELESQEPRVELDGPMANRQKAVRDAVQQDDLALIR